MKNIGYIVEKPDLPVRVATCKSGLGLIGKNCMFYGYDLGSYVGMLMIGTDLEFKRENQGQKQIANSICKKCNRCIKKCLTNTIYSERYRINPYKF